MSIVPNSRPQMKREKLEELIQKYIDWDKRPFLVVGVRGYYLNSMGEVGKNDRKLYDDAIFLMTKDFFTSFNANTDPQAFQDGIAKLQTGLWNVYKFDLHRGQYLALCQRAGVVTVTRDNEGEDTGEFGINIHHGSYNSVSSLGCQTIYPEEWEEFIDTAVEKAKEIYGSKWQNKIYPYLLVEVKEWNGDKIVLKNMEN